MHKLTRFGFVFLLLTTFVFGQGRALRVEDYYSYSLRTIGAPEISPNGRWVKFTVSSRVEPDNSTATETYIVPVDGSAQPRRIQHEGKDVSRAAWVEDNMLRYSAGGLWKVAVDTPNSAPVRAEAPPQGVLSFDGKWIAHPKEIPQPKPEPVYSSEFEKRHMERFKGRQFDWMRFQQDGQDYPTPDPRARPYLEIAITPAAGGETKQLTNLGYRAGNLAWHPNGTTIAFTAEPEWKNEQQYDDPDIFTVTTDGKVTRLTNDAYSYGSLRYSPDGRFLAYERSFGTDMIIQKKLNHGGSEDLFVLPAGGGEPINLTANWMYDPGTPAWSPDSRYIYFSADVGGTTHLFRVAPRAGAPVEQVTKGERRLNGINFDKAMTKMTYTVGMHEAPPEVWVANIDGSGERKLTNFMADTLREIAFSKADRLKWKSNDGTEIEGWLTYPYAYDRSKGPYPLIVFSHGGPHSNVGYDFNFKQQYFAANGYFVFDTNFRSSTGYGDAFKWATWGAWGTKDGQDVVSGVDHVIANYPVDRNRVAAIGHSYGGFMTNWLITAYPDRFAAAASGAGISNWISDYGTADIFRTKETEFFGMPWNEDAVLRMVAQSPLMNARRVRTPTLFIHGEVDQRVPYEEGEQLYFALRRQGVPAKMVQYAGMPHGISGHWNNVHRMISELKWFDQYLKKPR
jgi:dipeptidyl aminopeptidase/acylaminoacyl peptidase